MCFRGFSLYRSLCSSGVCPSWRVCECEKSQAGGARVTTGIPPAGAIGLEGGVGTVRVAFMSSRRPLGVIARMQMGVVQSGVGFRGAAYTLGSRAAISGINEFSVWEDMMGDGSQPSATSTPAVPPPRAKLRPLQQTKSAKSGTAQIKKRNKPPKSKKARPAACEAEELDDLLDEVDDAVDAPAAPQPSKSCKRGERQSSRQRLRPLEYWRGERVVYGHTEQGPSVVDVVIADDD